MPSTSSPAMTPLATSLTATEASPSPGLVRPLLTLFVMLTVVCGLIYPVIVTGLGKLLFPAQVAGSLIERHGHIIGSALIGQPFSSPAYFWGRPSATAPMPYNAAASSGSNLGPLNPALTDAVRLRIQALRAADPLSKNPVPVDLVTASASGLDPDISLAAAFYQSARVARQRHMPVEDVNSVINLLARTRHFGFLGEPRVNVLALNLALDQMNTPTP